jgi:hypothetical protein
MYGRRRRHHDWHAQLIKNGSETATTVKLDLDYEDEVLNGCTCHGEARKVMIRHAPNSKAMRRCDSGSHLHVRKLTSETRRAGLRLSTAGVRSRQEPGVHALAFSPNADRPAINLDDSAY